MEYILTIITLFLAELFYFKIADKFNIIDKPNERSSHSNITLRGGGVIFYISIVIFFVVSGFQYPWFMLGLTLMSVVSILDDISEVSTRQRLLVHFGAVLLMVYQIGAFDLAWYYLLLIFTVIVGAINAYNFMDGINGITAFYSLVIGALLLFVNHTVSFVAQDLLIYTLLGVVVFAFFNFRNTAKCFAGDVGSIGVAYILLFALVLLILKTGDFLYFLFVGIYGIDVVWTIIRRLYLGENIFEGHRTHLYQYLSNELGYNRLKVAGIYGAAQLTLGALVIYFVKFDAGTQWWFAILALTVLSTVYIILKSYIITNYTVKRKQEQRFNVIETGANYEFERKKVS